MTTSQYKELMNTIENLEYTNRELSWLGFNRRVLELSSSSNVPLGEKLKFASIFASNLDEFFMVRVGSLFDQTLLKTKPTENKTGLTPDEQLAVIMPEIASMVLVRDSITKKLDFELKDVNIQRVDFKKLKLKQLGFWRDYFLSEVEPFLSPQIIDNRHPFPFLRNLESYAIVTLKTKAADKFRAGLIPISPQLPRIITTKLDDTLCFAFVEDLILYFADLALTGLSVKERCMFRVTRNADLSMAESMLEHDLDYRVVMAELLKTRRKLAAVRLETSPDAPKEIIDFLLSKLELSPNHVFSKQLPLGMAAYYDVSKLLRQDKSNSKKMFYPHKSPKAPAKGYNLSEATNGRSVLACYPFHSFRPFITMLYDAATDPEVVSIKMTLYRLADDSKIIDALTIAAEHGKEVVAIVELRARFDEQNNIDLSNRLEDSGCTIFYGFENYKVHSKLCLITRVCDDKSRYISAIGTGNFNENTAELYTDISYITQDDAIGAEIATLFHDLSLGRNNIVPRKLLVAPNYFKTEILRQIDNEIENKKAGRDAAIVIKCNSISDRNMIDKLYEASSYGVKIELIIRGICCLKAGVPGLSENITVRSIVGRYLEHSRIYAFGVGEGANVYIASGDLLTRNTERRIEVGVQVTDDISRKTLLKVLEYQLLDNCNCWLLMANNRYERLIVREDEPSFDSHTELHNLFSSYDNGFSTLKEDIGKKKPSPFFRLFSYLFKK